MTVAVYGWVIATIIIVMMIVFTIKGSQPSMFEETYTNGGGGGSHKRKNKDGQESSEYCNLDRMNKIRDQPLISNQTVQRPNDGVETDSYIPDFYLGKPVRGIHIDENDGMQGVCPNGTMGIRQPPLLYDGLEMRQIDHRSSRKKMYNNKWSFMRTGCSTDMTVGCVDKQTMFPMVKNTPEVDATIQPIDYPDMFRRDMRGIGNKNDTTVYQPTHRRMAFDINGL